MSDLRKVLFVLENAAVPFDPRVWQEAITLHDAGWAVTVLCPFLNEFKKEKIDLWRPHVRDGISIYYFPLPFANNSLFSYLVEYLTAFFWISIRSWKIWREIRFKVIHLCNPPDIFFPIMFFYRMFGVRVIFDHHDLFPELITTRFHGIKARLMSQFALLMEFLTFRSAHFVITTNQSYKNIAIRRGKVPPSRIFIVRNGPKLSEFVPVEPKPEFKAGFSSMVAYAGVMGYQDGIFELLEAVRYIVQESKRNDILFVLLGDGAMKNTAEKLLKAWNIQCVHMPGMIRDNLLLRQYLSTADVLVSPEPFNELNNCSTFIKIGEYLAVEKPIVAYDLRETRYTAQDAAVYVMRGDKKGFANEIVRLVDEPEVRMQMAASARRRIAELAWESQQPILLSTYNLIIKERT